MPAFAHDDPGHAFRQVMDGRATVTVTVLSPLGTSAVALTRDQQARIIRLLYTATAWRPLEIAATEPFILITIDAGGYRYGMDSSQLYLESRLDYGIASHDSAVLESIRERCK